jgi:hypothetical protein
MECRRCTTGKTYRPDVVALFRNQPERIFTRTIVFQELLALGSACTQCCSPTHIGSLVYHLRQDGVVERVGKGTFRFRKSDTTTPDFIYARRPRKS